MITISLYQKTHLRSSVTLNKMIFFSLSLAGISGICKIKFSRIHKWGYMDKQIRKIEKKVKGTEKSLKSLEKEDKKRDVIVDKAKMKKGKC